MSAEKNDDNGGKGGNKTCPLGLITEKQLPVSIKSVKVDLNITGYIAEVSTRLTYFNKEKTAVEAVFTFPVDDGSAVFLFEADIDGRHIVAEVQRKEQTELTAKDAMDHGKTAMLLKEDNSAGDIFSCMLGNLPSQSEASLVMKHVIELPQEPDGRLRFTLPTVLNPRVPPGVDGNTAAEGATYVPASKVPYEFSMTATVEGYHKVSSVTSDRVKLDVKFEKDNKIAKVSVGDDFKFNHDLSFLVEYEEPYTLQVVLENGNPKAEGLFKDDLCMITFQPNLRKVAMATNGEYIFVIERSELMKGNKIENAKKALLLFVKSLPPDCYFNIIGFGSKINSLFRSSKKYTDSTLKDAIKLHAKMKADMGSAQILKPLEHIFGKKLTTGHPRRVILLTDATVPKSERYTAQVLELVKLQSQKTCTRIFTLGFGVSNTLVEEIASNGGGKAEFIGDQDRMQSKVISLLKCAMQPAIMDITLCWNLPSDVTPVYIPATPPATISAGERYTVYATLKGVDKKTVHAPSTVTLKGQQDGKSVSHSMTFTLCQADDISASAPVHHLATKVQIGLLQEQEASVFAIDSGYRFLREDCTNVDTLRRQIINHSCQGNIVSKYTSIVAIDTEGKGVEGKSVQQSCPVPAISDPFLHGIHRSMAENLHCNLCDYSLDGLELDQPYEFPAVSAADCSDGAVSVVDDDEMMSVIFLQQFRGQWNVSNELLQLLGFAKEDMQKLDFSKDTSVVCTVIVLGWLWKQFSHRQEEWQMIENKALTWISTHNLNTPTEDLITETTQVLWPVT